jgi:hypothetical protein
MDIPSQFTTNGRFIITLQHARSYNNPTSHQWCRTLPAWRQMIQFQNLTLKFAFWHIFVC